jgi:hypothetical protein
MVSHSNRHTHYTTDHGEVKLLSPGLGRDDGQKAASRLLRRLLRFPTVCYADHNRSLRTGYPGGWSRYPRQGTGSLLWPPWPEWNEDGEYLSADHLGFGGRGSGARR